MRKYAYVLPSRSLQPATTPSRPSPCQVHAASLRQSLVAHSSPALHTCKRPSQKTIFDSFRLNRKPQTPMTTAARPTFLPAIGGNSFSDKGGTPTSIVRAKEQTAHTKLKQRHDLFGTEDESSPAELKRKLLEDEREHFEKERKRLLGPGALDDPEDAAKRRRMLEERNLDADDDSDDSDDSEDKDRYAFSRPFQRMDACG
ncbi:hypothetical protein BC831DRAFT_485244 [Entophlyctis helioformis]|nr:hypothetical protein BC831DRAFT_485244 [Entophlyctis helioformis]